MTVGRPRKFDSEKALNDAMKLFWRKGYEATSMQDLLDTMHLSKSSLYQTFDSKHALFEQCLEHYRKTILSHFKLTMKDAGSGQKFIEQIINSLLKNNEQMGDRIGCLISNTAAEFSQRDSEIARLTKKGTETFTHIFLEAVEQAQSAGDINPKRDAKRLARYLLSSINGLNIMIKAGATQDVLEDIAAEILDSIK